MTFNFKRKYGVKSAMVFFLAFQIFLFPFVHYHPDNVHAHQGELSPHKHQGHFHSPGFEKLSNVIDPHFPEPVQEDGSPHSHPFSSHGVDFVALDLDKSSLNSGKILKKFKDLQVQSLRGLSTSVSSSPKILTLLNANVKVPIGLFQERSPPVLLI